MPARAETTSPSNDTARSGKVVNAVSPVRASFSSASPVNLEVPAARGSTLNGTATDRKPTHA